MDHMTPENLKAFYDEVPKYLADGSIPVKEHVFKGLDNVRTSLIVFPPFAGIGGAPEG